MKTFRTLAPLLLAVALVLHAPAQGPFPVDASAAIPRTGNATFFARHESFLARVKAGPVGLLFLGDSITARWSGVPELWEARYGRYQPANFGIGGDHTHNLIWRIDNGALNGIVSSIPASSSSGRDVHDRAAGKSRARPSSPSQPPSLWRP